MPYQPWLNYDSIVLAMSQPTDLFIVTIGKSILVIAILNMTWLSHIKLGRYLSFGPKAFACNPPKGPKFLPQ